MEGFLALYAKTNKEAIRANRDKIAERLGFLRRVVHGGNPRYWMHEVKAVLGAERCRTQKHPTFESDGRTTINWTCVDGR
ncbi:MAG: hypothetical protein ACRD11_06350 [Terriglobia bacterium]